MSRKHLSISGISQLLLVWFWPKIKSRFLELFLTFTNCHSDICQGNVCPGDICPYQEYISCYWPNFDQTFLAQFFESLNFLAQNFVSPKFFEHNNFLDQNCFGDICPYQDYLSCYWPDFFETFWVKFFCNQNFEDQNFFWTLIFFYPTSYCINIAFEPKFFLDKIRFWIKKFCGPWYLTNNYHKN